jgi:hypothetical protein
MYSEVEWAIVAAFYSFHFFFRAIILGSITSLVHSAVCCFSFVSLLWGLLHPAFWVRPQVHHHVLWPFIPHLLGNLYHFTTSSTLSTLSASTSTLGSASMCSGKLAPICSVFSLI